VDGGKPRAAVGEFGDLTFDVERHDGDLADKCHCCSQRDLFVDGAMTSVMPRKNTAAAPAGSASRAALPSARASTPPTSSSTTPPDGCTNKVNWRTPAAPQRTKVASSGRRLLPAWCRWITATPEKRDAVAASGSKTWTTASSDAVAARVHAEVPERDKSSRKGKRSMAADATHRTASVVVTMGARQRKGLETWRERVLADGRAGGEVESR
jgi:hypothetical protein